MRYLPHKILQGLAGSASLASGDKPPATEEDEDYWHGTSWRKDALANCGGTWVQDPVAPKVYEPVQPGSWQDALSYLDLLRSRSFSHVSRKAYEYLARCRGRMGPGDAMGRFHFQLCSEPRLHFSFYRFNEKNPAKAGAALTSPDVFLC